MFGRGSACVIGYFCPHVHLNATASSLLQSNLQSPYFLSHSVSAAAGSRRMLVIKMEKVVVDIGGERGWL